MKKIKLFTKGVHTKDSDFEKEVNAWLAEHAKIVTIVSQEMSVTAVEIMPNQIGTIICLSILYT